MRRFETGGSVRQQIESYLATLKLHLDALESAIGVENYTLAEAELHGALSDMRHVLGLAKQVSN
jgi:hypothetical protein